MINSHILWSLTRNSLYLYFFWLIYFFSKNCNIFVAISVTATNKVTGCNSIKFILNGVLLKLLKVRFYSFGLIKYNSISQLFITHRGIIMYIRTFFFVLRAQPGGNIYLFLFIFIRIHIFSTAFIHFIESRIWDLSFFL